ncbi:FHA domain-containing protein [Qiania dongpingensis]|uniref:FHA domain-containing protein n=1 Tax=Qiania dongpingensis TaxID=2763669 RepID=A0A7G9G484_9FIRM|nr:FHA domain-containing protein [Qiania dongpingensis]QNM05616.1 FHA domain-containing protein [Qiania dongpingensis]
MDRIDRQAPTEAVFDGITYEMLIFNDIEGVLKLEIDETAGEARYITDGYSPLPRMFPGRMPKKAVVQVLKSLLGVWVNLDEYMIPRNELLMELSDVFINEESGEIKWICGLQKDSRSPIEKLRLFMTELVNVMEGNPEKNQENMITLLKYVKGVKQDNLDQCREMADALLLQDIAADSAEAAAAENPVSFGLEMPGTDNAPEFSYEEETSEDGLDIMLPDAFAAREIAYIIRIRTGDEMAVVLDETLIGKSPDADFCIPDNRAVSRHHASILMDEGEYYLVDHNSTNSTYLNGMRLDPGDEYRLCHGDGFVLADEPFQFMIR